MLSGSGELTIVLSDGKHLDGSYAADTLTLSSCGSIPPGPPI
jgi:hypothetical protein